MAANHGLVMSHIEEFLVSNLEEELADCNKQIEQQTVVLTWNVVNNVPPSIQAKHQAKLERLQSQKRELIRWQEELLLSEALLNSILRQ
jgi:hypothetical protein